MSDYPQDDRPAYEDPEVEEFDFHDDRPVYEDDTGDLTTFLQDVGMEIAEDIATLQMKDPWAPICVYRIDDFDDEDWLAILGVTRQHLAHIAECN